MIFGEEYPWWKLKSRVPIRPHQVKIIKKIFLLLNPDSCLPPTACYSHYLYASALPLVENVWLVWSIPILSGPFLCFHIKKKKKTKTSIFSSLAHFLIGSFIFLELSCISCLYIFDISCLSVASFAIILRVPFLR